MLVLLCGVCFHRILLKVSSKELGNPLAVTVSSRQCTICSRVQLYLPSSLKSFWISCALGNVSLVGSEAGLHYTHESTGSHLLQEHAAESYSSLLLQSRWRAGRAEHTQLFFSWRIGGQIFQAAASLSVPHSTTALILPVVHTGKMLWS